MTRHALGLYRGDAGARGWRRVLSDSNRRLAARDLTIFDEARAHLREAVELSNPDGALRKKMLEGTRQTRIIVRIISLLDCYEQF